MYVIMCVSYTKHHQNRLAHWITAKSLICDHDLRALHKHTVPQKFPWQMATYRHVEWCRDPLHSQHHEYGWIIMVFNAISNEISNCCIASPLAVTPYDNVPELHAMWHKVQDDNQHETHKEWQHHTLVQSSCSGASGTAMALWHSCSQDAVHHVPCIAWSKDQEHIVPVLPSEDC